ncbi:hypothetical protein [Streptomyces sp. NPDC059209]|uniref:hypothetical protein n=1 Tax=Streptomyces sp. NPDC059209 TaxID=3346769 RepID=UPI003686ED3F
MRGGQLSEKIGDFPGGGGRADLLGKVQDPGAEREVVLLAQVGVEHLVAVDVVAHGAQPGDGTGGERDFLGAVEAGGEAVVVLVDAYDGYPVGALEDAVRFGISAAGEDFAGVRIPAQGEQAVGQGQAGAFLRARGRFTGGFAPQAPVVTGWA